MPKKTDINEIYERIDSLYSVERQTPSNIADFVGRGKPISSKQKTLVDVLSEPNRLLNEVQRKDTIGQLSRIRSQFERSTIQVDEVESLLERKEREAVMKDVKDVIDNLKDTFGDDWQNAQTFGRFRSNVGNKRIIDRLGINLKSIYERGEI